jgi:hypothetical protein
MYMMNIYSVGNSDFDNMLHTVVLSPLLEGGNDSKTFLLQNYFSELRSF